MTVQRYFCFCAIFFFCSCANHSGQGIAGDKKKDNIRFSLNKPFSNFSDTVQIHSPSAIFYEPDSLQLLAIKNITDSIIFTSTIHESFYQMRYSKIVLRRDYPSIKIVEIKNARFILFTKTNEGHELIDLNTKNDPFGLLVFDGYQSPQLMDMTNIETSLGFYFTK